MKESQRTIFIIDDSPEDRMVYRRFLERNSQYNYEIVEFEEANVALQCCQQTMPDLILLDFFLPDASGLEFLEELKVHTGKNHLPVVMLSGQGDETVAVQAMKNGALDYLVKGRLSLEALNRACHTVMERVSLMQQLEQQQEQQRLIGAIALRIRKSLSLDTVLNTAVDEIRSFLKADRVLVYQFHDDMSGTIVAESVLPGWNSFLNVQLQDTFLCDHADREYSQCGRCVVDNIYKAGLSQCEIQQLEKFQLVAHLIVPIVSCSGQSEPGIVSFDVENPLWGLLIVHQCSTPRQWQQSEIDLLDQLSVQLAIAIQQAELYQNLQTLNARLEAKVHEREAIFNESADAIFLVDADSELTIDCNRRAVELFEASSKEELLDINGQILHRYQLTNQELEELTDEINTHGFWSREIEYQSRKGNCFWGNLAVKQISVASRAMQLVRVTDISERKKTMEQIRRSLEEKETLLKEIHHRVKNNLQIISSLLRMQSRRPLDEATLILFQESQNRVQSMALIHEQLYQSPDLSQIDFGEYIRSLTDNLFRCYGVSRVALNIKTNGLKLTLDTAIPCGLIINELVSNSLKYAFPQGRKGDINIFLQSTADNTVTLTVSDSGIGIPETLDWQNSNSLGLRIVRNLTKQLKGNISLDCSNGTTFHIVFCVN